LECKKENKFKFSAEELKAVITPKAKMLIFNSPSNPTGAVYNEEEVRAIAKVCEKHEIFVLADAIYEKLCYNGVKPFSIAKCSEKMQDLTITVNGVSRTFSTDAIDHMESEKTYIPFLSQSYNAAGGQSAAIEVSWRFNGTYGGMEIGTLTTGVILQWDAATAAQPDGSASVETAAPDAPDTPDTPTPPDAPDTPDIPDTPVSPDVPTEPDAPSTEPTDPPAEPTDPVNPTEPAVPPTEPTESSEPPAEPGEDTTPVPEIPPTEPEPDPEPTVTGTPEETVPTDEA
jgi:hypothetical protein